MVRILHVLAHFVPPPGAPASSTAAESPLPVETTPFPEERLRLDALEGAYELPTCPVCLERLDASLSGLGTCCAYDIRLFKHADRDPVWIQQ